MGWVVYFSRKFRKLGVSTLCNGIFDETIIVQRSFENSEAFPDFGELEDDFSNNNRCLLSVVISLFTQLLCLAVLQCCCTVKRLSAVTFTSHILQNKISPSLLKYLSPNSLIKPRNFTLLEHLTLGILKLYWTTEVMNTVLDGFRGEGRNLPLCGWKNFSPICNKQTGLQESLQWRRKRDTDRQTDRGRGGNFSFQSGWFYARSRTVTLHTVQYSFKSRYTRPNISKKGSSK